MTLAADHVLTLVTTGNLPSSSPPSAGIAIDGVAEQLSAFEIDLDDVAGVDAYIDRTGP
jgi:hypothetical protein